MNPRTTRLRPPRRAVFTIVEVVVLISIVGIIGAVAAPRFLAMSEMDAVRAHRQTLADLRFAQALSASSGCPVQVDFTGTAYTLTKRTGCRSGPFTLPVVDPISNQAPYLINLPSGVAITSTVDPLVFDALGRSTMTAGTVTNASISVGGHALEAIGETGLVRIP
jgi:MSHA pilin protein MshC